MIYIIDTSSTSFLRCVPATRSYSWNAQSDYNCRTGYKQFCLKLAKELIGDYNERNGMSLLHQWYQSKRTTPTHYPIKGRKGRSSYCHNTLHIRYESSIRCNRCDVSLCIEARLRNHASNYITLTSNSVSGWLPRKILAGVAVLALEILWPEIPLNTFLYNKYMGGVDIADQFRSYYQWKLKSRKSTCKF